MRVGQYIMIILALCLCTTATSAQEWAIEECKSTVIPGSTPVVVIGCADGDFSVLDAVAASTGTPKRLFHFEASNASGGFFQDFGTLRKARKKGGTSTLKIVLHHHRNGVHTATLRVTGKRVSFDSGY